MRLVNVKAKYFHTAQSRLVEWQWVTGQCRASLLTMNGKQRPMPRCWPPSTCEPANVTTVRSRAGMQKALAVHSVAGLELGAAGRQKKKKKRPFISSEGRRNAHADQSRLRDHREGSSC